MKVKVFVVYATKGYFVVDGVNSTQEAQEIVSRECGVNVQVTTGTLECEAYEFDMKAEPELFMSEEIDLPPKKEVTISGKYNEHGYVIFANKKPIYAAGNYSNESQSYLGSCDHTGDKLQLPIDHRLAPLEVIKGYCENSVMDFTKNSLVYPGYLKKFPADRYEFVSGEVSYNKRLSPRKAAHLTGDLPLS
jgi:hypothetical protein